MGEIKKNIYKNKNLTVITVSGKTTLDMIIDALEEFYRSVFTLNLLWDFSKGDARELTNYQMRDIISVAKKYAHLRKGGKTAFFVSSGVDYGLARMYEIYSDIEGHTISHNVFYDFDKAMDWLEI